MAKAKNEGLKVLNTVNVKPSKLVLNEKFMGRSKLVDDDSVATLAQSLRTNGQQQPIQVRQIPGTDTYEVIFGNTRKRAGDLIENGYPWEKKEVPANPDFTLRAEVVDVSDEEAFSRNIVEQANRNATSAWDNAVNQKRLREEYNMSDAAIARLYGWSGSAMVNRLKKLHDLPDFVQDAVHTGNMTAYAAFMLADAKDVKDANAYDDVWKLVKSSREDEGGSIGATEIGLAIKEWRKARTEAEQAANATATGETPATGEGGTATGSTGEGGTATGEGGTATAPKAIPLSLKQFKDTLADSGGDERCPPVMKQFCEITLSFLKGETDQTAWGHWLMATFGEELLPPVEKTPEAAPTEAPTNGQPENHSEEKSIEELNAEHQAPKPRKRKAAAGN